MTDRRELSRSEQVRKRRNDRTVQEMHQTREQALKPAVRVTSRTKNTPIVIAPKQRERRRNFNVALGLPEINLRVGNFSLPKFGANWRTVALGVALTLGLVIYLALSLPFFLVPSAVFTGNSRYSQEELNSVLGVTGRSIFTVQPDEVRLRLLTNYPELLSADVHVSLPNQVSVEVVERQPVILWLQQGGYTWIDSMGVAFRPKGDMAGIVSVNGLDVPPAGVASTGDPLSPPPFLDTELVETILALAPAVPAGVTMEYSAADGLGWTDPRGWRVVFGTGVRDMPLKIRVYQALVDSLAQRGITPQFISVVHPDGPFYRMAGSSKSTETNP
ncbi:MAG TPA: FtsQ-type POTRA domain-containing protein [Anaerolineales bacterium]|nr:FtsQ-type POTRA domain-containing protein [Anaerolineales bacterium]HNO31881.1 FtsQ-type POTRA domain-containing protein [Anaerolineales bacterium]